MSAIVRCRWCGAEFEVGREQIVAGDWRRLCPHCRPTPPDPSTAATCCEGCGRPAVAGGRRICARCAGVMAA